MSFLSNIKRFDGKSLKPVDTNLTTADGKKVQQYSKYFSEIINYVHEYYKIGYPALSVIIISLILHST